MSGYSIEKSSVIRTQPVGIEVSDYTIKQLKQEAINNYFENLIKNGDVFILVNTEVVEDVVNIKVSIRENLYV